MVEARRVVDRITYWSMQNRCEEIEAKLSDSLASQPANPLPEDFLDEANTLAADFLGRLEILLYKWQVDDE